MERRRTTTFQALGGKLPFAGVFLGSANIQGGSGGNTVHRCGGFKGYQALRQPQRSGDKASASRQPRGANRQSATAIVFGLAVYR